MLIEFILLEPILNQFYNSNTPFINLLVPVVQIDGSELRDKAITA